MRFTSNTLKRFLYGYGIIGLPLGFQYGTENYNRFINNIPSNPDYTKIENYPISIMSIGVSMISTMTWPIIATKCVRDYNNQNK